MLVLNPEVVRFDEWVWEDVAAVTVDRSAARLIEEWDDLGPFARLVDVPEIRVSVRVLRRVNADDLDGPAPGTAGTLTFYTCSGGGDARRRRVRVACACTGVKSDVQAAGAEGAAPRVTQTISFTGFAQGNADPVKVEEWSPGL